MHTVEQEMLKQRIEELKHLKRSLIEEVQNRIDMLEKRYTKKQQELENGLYRH